jgi:hypothetical protein
MLLLLEVWGQPPITPAADSGNGECLQSLQRISGILQHWHSWRVAELHKLYPIELQQLFVGGHPVPASLALAAVMEA